MPPLTRTRVEPLLRHVARRIKLDAEETREFLSILTIKQIRRGHFLLQEGDVAEHENYVLKGCLRAYTLDADGNEHVIHLAIEDWWIGDLASVLLKSPARLSVEALEDSEVIQIRHDALEQLYTRIPKFERYFRLLLQGAFLAHQERILSNIALDARSRYEQFAARYPQFLDRVPQKYVASYLGITPESLSRIRRSLVASRRAR